MAQLNFGGTVENVVTREEFPLEKAREVLKNETIAVIGYGVQGPGQSLNLRDNGFNVIIVKPFLVSRKPVKKQQLYNICYLTQHKLLLGKR
jgi:ketol-acid reductoisomerase